MIKDEFVGQYTIPMSDRRSYKGGNVISRFELYGKGKESTELKQGFIWLKLFYTEKMDEVWSAQYMMSCSCYMAKYNIRLHVVTCICIHRAFCCQSGCLDAWLECGIVDLWLFYQGLKIEENADDELKDFSHSFILLSLIYSRVFFLYVIELLVFSLYILKGYL